MIKKVAATALLIFVIPQFALAFFMPKDVTLGTYYYDSVRQATEHKIIVENPYFYPERALTRAQFVDWFVKVLGVETVTPETPSFKDVPKTYATYTSIETAKKLNLISGTQSAEGTPTGKFEPNALVNRAQAAVIIMKAFVHLTSTAYTFKDLGNVSWAQDSIKRAATAGFFSGYQDGTFGPAKNILKAEGITVFMKIYLKLSTKQLGTAFAK